MEFAAILESCTPCDCAGGATFSAASVLVLVSGNTDESTLNTSTKNRPSTSKPRKATRCLQQKCALRSVLRHRPAARQDDSLLNEKTPPALQEYPDLAGNIPSSPAKYSVSRAATDHEQPPATTTPTRLHAQHERTPPAESSPTVLQLCRRTLPLSSPNPA